MASGKIVTDPHWSRGSELLELMRHAVGKDGYRNNFAAEVGGRDYDSWNTLCGLGLATAGGYINVGTMRYFYVSEAGVAFLRKLNPRRYKRELTGYTDHG
ncbi:MAG: hypothetical protein V4739_17455 [Pseudomonadota bacterium]